MFNRCNSSFNQESYNNSVYSHNKKVFFKVILIGDLHVGKTTLAKMFLKEFLREKNVCHIIMDYNSKEILINDIRVEIQLWDTCGQEEYQALTKQYYRDTKGVLLIYDMTEPKSFTNLNRWIEEINSNINQKVPVILIANKKDLIGLRKVSEVEGKCFAEKNKYLYIETSGVTLLNIKEAFKELGILMLKDNNIDFDLDHCNSNIKKTEIAKKKKKDILKENLEERDKLNKKRVNCC